MHHLLSLIVLFCNLGAGAAEGPRAFFGFATTYQVSESGQGRVEIDSLVPGSPAERAGLKQGDVIIAFDGKGFGYANEYEYLGSLGNFAAGDKVEVSLERDGQKLELTLVPAPLSPQQAEAVANHMAMLRHCVDTGKDCPCSMSPEACRRNTDLRTSYRRYLDEIAKHGGRSVLRVEKSAGGAIGFSSDPVPLPAHFELDPQEDQWLWQTFKKLEPGGSLAVEIQSTPEGSRRIRLLPAAPGS